MKNNIIRTLVMFLIRKKLGVKKYQEFRFCGHEDAEETYCITDHRIVKLEIGAFITSNVALNWLLSGNCTVEKIKGLCPAAERLMHTGK